MLRSSLFVCLLATVYVFSQAKPVPEPLQWGADGHWLVAEIAQTLLSSDAQNAVAKLLPDSQGDMGAIASWADDVRHTEEYRWSAPLHFINTPDWACDYSRSRDCPASDAGVPLFCVDGAIVNYTQRLTDSSLDQSQKNEALKFLVHFVGDIHQPLHVGFIGDTGGNDITGTFEGESNTNLHEVWDTKIIYQRIDNDFGDKNTYLQYFTGRLQNSSDIWSSAISKWQSCATSSPANACSIDWAPESISLACSNAYVNVDGSKIKSGYDLEDPYYHKNFPIVEEQLAKAGVRLAHVLNTVFAAQKKPSPTPKIAFA